MLRPRLCLVLIPLAMACATEPREPACSTVDVSGRGVYYCLGGLGDVTVILESDAGVDHTSWDSIAPGVARFAKVLTHDRLGLGRSDSADAPRTPANVARELENLLRTVKVEGPLVLVGQRKGGQYVRAFAAEYPAGIRRLILIDNPHDAFEQRVRAVLTPEQLRQLDSTGRQRGAALTRGAIREEKDLAATEPTVGIDAPVTMIHASLLDRPDSVVAIIESAVGPPSRRNPFSWVGDPNSPIINSLIVAALLALIGLVVRWLKRRHDEGKVSRNPNTVLVWDLIRRPSLWDRMTRSAPDRSRAVALLEAINRGAELSTEESTARISAKSSGSKAVRIWHPLQESLRVAKHAFIMPECRVYEHRLPLPEVDGIAAVKRWLEDFQAGRDAPEGAGRILVVASGGAGKSIFMNRLFLKLIGAHPVPMLASASNLQTRPGQIAKLLESSDTVHAFVEGWLENRLEVPEYARESLVRDFADALKHGEIVLVFDGTDELDRQGLGDFAADLLGKGNIRFWVVSQRRGRRRGGGFLEVERRVELGDTWTADQIAAHVELWWPKVVRPGAAADAAGLLNARDTLIKVIRGVVQRHERVTGNGARREQHWLSLPRNLDFFLKDILEESIRNGVPDEDEIRHRAENQPYLFSKILNSAIDRIKAPPENHAAIQEKLFEIAIKDPGRGRGIGVVSLDGPVGNQVRELTELLDTSREPLTFRHAALRDYFVAGRIAWELNRGPSSDDELLRDELWSAPRLAAVASWVHELAADPVEDVRSRIPRYEPDGQGHLRAAPISAEAPRPHVLRNLLDLLIRVELEFRRDRRKIRGVSHLDFSRMAGEHLDLQLIKVDRCSFQGATLDDAELTHAEFSGCDFRRAKLSGADAVGASFEDCNFGAKKAEYAVVEDMAIEGAEFTPHIVADLTSRGASLERSRYRGEFGKRFWEAQQAFLGPGLERLENDSYIPAIKEAVKRWHGATPRAPVYLVDLMAGGGYQRITALLEKFDRLRILGVDRDFSTQRSRPRFKWAPVEIGGNSSDGEAVLGLDLHAELEHAFRGAPREAHVIVAKKALHELDRQLQPDLIRECADSLCSEGRLILFVDAPGPLEGAIDPVELERVYGELESLRRKLEDPSVEPAEVAALLDERQYDGRASGQIEFANSWIMLKDWANVNRHEVSHRYFAGVPEILGWAAKHPATQQPLFGPPVSVAHDRYRLNPLIFNELGIQRVLHYLVRKGGNPDQVVKDNRQQLAEWISARDRSSGRGRFWVLLDFTRKKLRSDSDLAKALNARDETVALEKIHPALAPLNSDETAPTFDLPCAVLVFEKR
jgi:pimeloyl-ACP methyl ester carboxylesterase